MGDLGADPRIGEVRTELAFEGVPGPEGLVYAPDGDLLVSGSDGWIYRRTEGDLARYVEVGGRPLGMAMDQRGRLIVCEMASSSVLVVSHGGEVSVLSRGAVERPFQVPNFAVFDEAGRLYVSDSGSASLDDPRPDGAVVRIDPDGSAHVIATGLFFANGLAIRLGEAAIYVAQSSLDNVLRVGLEKDGSVASSTVFCEIDRTPDGLAFDVRGTLYVTALGTDAIVAFDGHASVRFRSSALAGPANLAFHPGGAREAMVTNLHGRHVSRVSGIGPGQPLFHQTGGSRDS